MVEAVSKRKNKLFCSNCHSKLPKELTQINKKGENIIFCPYCGTQITLKNDFDDNKIEKTLSELPTETKETKETKDVKFSLTDKEIRHIIRIFIYRNIYQMIQQKKAIMRRLIRQKDLMKSQISYLTSKMRNTLLNTSNPVQGAPQELTNPAIRKLDIFYKKFKTSLNNKKASREKYSQLLAENIEFIYNLIRGDYTFEDLSETKRTIVLDLKQFFGFIEENQSKKAVNYHVSLFLAIKIYAIIKQNKNTPLNKSTIDELTNNLTEFVIHNDFRKEFYNTLEIYQKRSLTNFLKEFEFNITYDWVYRTSFQDHVFKLIYLVNQLFHENGYWSNLTGPDKLIAEGLQESPLFQNDYEFSTYFRLNLTIVLCRIIHKIMQDSPDSPQDISNHPHLNPSLKQEILAYLLKELTALKNINFEFLEKFYKLSLEEFQTNYKNFQVKVASDMIYYHNFRTYLSKLIKIVHAITHSIRKKSHLSKVERVIINDLANYNFRWNPERGTKYYFYSNEKEPEKINNKKRDIFTIDIPDDSPLWRIRAYVIGFLLADGYIQYKYRRYRLIVPQHAKDKNILRILNKALGGEIKGPSKKNHYRLVIYNKKLIKTLINHGMVEAHSKQENAIKIIPPEFIKIKISGQSLLKDFVRGFFDGDGWFTGNYESRTTRFEILGPELFLSALESSIKSEIPDLTSSIYSEKKRVFIDGDKVYNLYGKFKISVPGEGYKILTYDDLERGKIENIEHPWLKILCIAGSYNSIKFFNWLYENNDIFNKKKVDGIRICGIRKFKKALSVLGDYSYRKEKLAPKWQDVLPEVIPLMEARFYKAKELMELTNSLLKERLTKLNLSHLYESNKTKNIDAFRKNLKNIEFFDKIIVRYQMTKGRVNYNYYHNSVKPPKKIPKYYKRKIDLIDSKGIKKNVKNLIIYYFLKEQKTLKYEHISEGLKKLMVFSKWALMPRRLKLDLAELNAFELIIADDDRKEIHDRLYALNYNLLPNFYQTEIKTIRTLLKNIFNT